MKRFLLAALLGVVAGFVVMRLSQRRGQPDAGDGTADEAS